MEPERKTGGFTMKFFALGALLMYFFDPQNGRRRRAMARDRSAGLFRHGWRKSERLGRGVAADAYGVKQKLTHLKEEEKPQPDDVTLARKVETEIFRDPDVPKGQINVNAEEGKVVLRGEVPRPEMIDDLVEKTRSVQGVREVENLLRLPSAPASPSQ
jgi:osmotically-inducible protein OsmY